jgi:hypothetical protein
MRAIAKAIRIVKASSAFRQVQACARDRALAGLNNRLSIE